MAAQSITFTQARLKSLEPQSKTYIIHDTKQPALQVRVTTNGAVSFLVRRRPKGSRKVVTVTICKMSDGYSVDSIRKEAAKVVAQLNRGVNPNEQRKRERAGKQVASKTLGEAYEEFKAKLNPHTQKPLTDGSLKAYKVVIERDLADWSGLPMIDITTTMVLNRYKDLLDQHGKSAGKRMASLLNAVWTYANDLADKGNGELAYGHPPMHLLNKLLKGWRKSNVRTLKVSGEDLPEWFAAVREEGGVGGGYLEILMLTGLRRAELEKLRWDDIDMRRRIMSFPDTKTGNPHSLPITDRVMDLLRWSRQEYPDADRPFPVSNPRTPVKHVIQRCGVDFTPHALRRTFTTLADLCGCGQYVLKRILNHAANAGITAKHYAQFDAADLREPMQKVENFILSKAKAHRDNLLKVVK